MASGKIVKIIEEKGFGFIQPEDGGKDLFFHVTGLLDRNQFEALQEEQRVTYNLDTAGDKPRAVEVTTLN